MQRREEYDALRMLCNILIVLHHTSFASLILSSSGNGLYILIRDVSWTLPTFFLLSGYLLFQNMDIIAWKGKLLRRIKRLLIPFIIWNAIFVALFLIVKLIMPMTVKSFENGAGQSIPWCLGKILGVSVQTGDPPLWYIRTLMMYVFASPLLIFIFKARSFCYVWITALLCFAIVADALCWNKAIKIIVPPYSLICFSIGAYIAHCKQSLVDLVLGHRIAFFIVGLFGYIIGVWTVPRCCVDLIYCLYAWFWPVVVFVGIGLFRNIVATTLIKPSFFIFAFHFMFRPFWEKFWLLLGGHFDIVGYLYVPVFFEFVCTIGICCACYYMIRWRFPIVADILNGDLK